MLTGRRGVGKTALMRHAFEGMDKAYLFVSRDSEALLCRKFQKALAEQLGITACGAASSLGELFALVMRESLRRHFTLVIDEFQDLERCSGAVFSHMQDIWDRYHASSRLNLVACGSGVMQMRRIFGGRSEPLFGRQTAWITLRPFSTDLIKKILRDANPNFTSEDLLCLFMLTGGVAKHVGLLMDAGCAMKDAMLDCACRMDSFFIAEGFRLLSSQFQGEYSAYFSIMQLIARGVSRRSGIDSAMHKDTGAFLRLLDERYEMIRKIRPILSRPGGKTSAYDIRDEFLRFWLRFICPMQPEIEMGRLDIVRRNMAKHYEEFSLRTLERYFLRKLMET